MKKAAMLLALLLCAVLFCGCDTDVASEKEIIEFANETYGKSEFLYSETQGEDDLCCYFTDDEYGFTYYVRSYVHGVGLDGSVFWFSEDKSSDFTVLYYEHIRSATDSTIASLSQKYNVSITTEDTIYGRSFDVELTSDNVDSACAAAEEVCELLRSYDARGYWENICCRVYDKDGNKRYTYDILHEKPLTPEDEEIEYFTEMAQMKNREAQYLRKDTRLFSETGITEDRLVHILGTELPTADSVITYYYFTAEGKEFFLADVQVYYPDYSSMSWHTNYLEVFGE